MTPPPHILIAEDDPHLRRYFAALSADLGAELTFVSDGHAALYKLLERPYALVLVDVVMPKMDGFDVCRAIKGNPHMGAARVVLTSALGRDPAERALEAGADDFLPKSLPQFLMRARLALHVAPPPIPPGPWVLLTADTSLAALIQVQAKALGLTLFITADLDHPDLLWDRVGTALLDTALGIPRLTPLIHRLPRGLPRVLLYDPMDVPLLETAALPLTDALQKPLSGPALRHRIKLLRWPHVSS